MLFFLEFSCPGRVWTEVVTKIFFLPFAAYIIPFWLKIMLEGGFFNFLYFLSFFFWNFHARVENEWNSGINFFFLFLGLSQHVLDRNNAGINFFNLLNFFTIFYFEFSCSVWVGTEFGSKIFFSLSRPISSRFGQK